MIEGEQSSNCQTYGYNLAKYYHQNTMNFRDDRKRVFCDSFGSESSNATSIHSVLNMCMTVPIIVRNMKILPTCGQYIPSHSAEIILKVSQSTVCITGITKMPDIHNTCRGSPEPRT